MGEQLTRAARLEAFLKLDPDNVELLRDLAECYHLGGDHARALKCYERLIEVGGETPAALNGKGAVLLASGRWQEAAAVLGKAVAADKTAAALHFNLGYAQLGAGAAHDALRSFTHAIERKGDDPRLYYYLAFAQDDVGDGRAAEAALARALALDPKHHDSLVLSVHLRLARGQIDEARQALEQLIASHPKSVEGLWLKGQIAMLDFDATKAIEFLQRAHELAPDDVSVLISLGQANLMLQRASAARKALKRAVELDAAQAGAWIALGWASLFAGDIGEAERCFAGAVELDRNLADAHAGLALVRLSRNETASARQALDEAKRCDPSNIAALITEAGLAGKEGGQAAAQAVVRKLMQTGTLGQTGWTNRELIDRARQSPSGKRVAQKWARYLRKKQGAAPLMRH